MSTQPSPPGPAPADRRAASQDVEAIIARLLLGGALVGVVLLAAGVVLMAVNGLSPTAAVFPPFDPATVIPDMLALRPEGYLWAGIVILIATPIARVLGELVTFATRGDRLMALVALAILGVIVLSVVVALVLEG